MSTSKIPIKIYISPGLHAELIARHPAYGELGRVIQTMLAEYALRIKQCTPASSELIEGGTTSHGN
jgi:hypothetical protein